jgi:CRP-like cAMP-binding protein
MVSLLKQPAMRMPDWAGFLPNSIKTALVGQSQKKPDKSEIQLVNTPLFADLSEVERQILFDQMQVCQFNSGEIIFSQNDESTCLYLLVDGRVNLVADDRGTVEDTLQSGSLLGVTQFLLKQPHSQTAKAVDKTTVLWLDEPTLTSIVTTHANIGVQLGLALGRGIVQFHSYLANQIAGAPLLSGFSDSQRRILAQYLTPYRCKPRDFIYRSGDPPTGIFVVDQGEVLLSSDADTEVAKLSVGDTFGERAVIYGTPHSFTAQALSDVTLWLLSPADFAALAGVSPSAAATISHNCYIALTEALHVATRVIEEEIESLGIVAGPQHPVTRELRNIRRTLIWIKNHQIAA